MVGDASALSTVAVAIFTAILVWFTLLAGELARREPRSIVQRAYISVAPHTAGFTEDALGFQVIAISAQVKNFGETPAKVLDTQLFINHRIDDLPNDPPYGPPDGQASAAYLVKGDAFNTASRFV